MDDLKQFRQLGSLTPGHPEYGHTVGVDATTGPLGQGLGMAVGMAMGQAHLATVFNKPGYDLFDHYVLCISWWWMYDGRYFFRSIITCRYT